MKNLLLIAITILAVGCGGKDESTTETKPKLEGVNKNELEFREFIYYLKDSDTPYTGKAYALHENGNKYWEVNHKDGKKDGLQTTWYENGQKQYEENYKEGNFDGVFASWHENGQKSSEASWKEGKQDGLGVSWYENGQKAAKYYYKDGKEDGLSVSWHKNGQKSFEGNFKDGNIVEGSDKYWNSKGEPVDTIEEARK